VCTDTFINNLFIDALPDVGRVRTMKRIFKTDPNLLALIDDLKAKERETGAAIWRDIAKRLEKPKRNWAEMNLSKLDRNAEAGDVILVPGKVLAAGSISKNVTVAAYSFSEKASEAIATAGGKTMSIADLMAENPKGSGVRIMR
jgi:large subunit ribosomal protein L18e